MMEGDRRRHSSGSPHSRDLSIMNSPILAPESPAREPLSLAGMIPGTWLGLGRRTVLVTGFECLRVQLNLEQGPRILDFEGMRILLFHGELHFPSGGDFRLSAVDGGGIRGEAGPLAQRKSTEGVHALFLALSDDESPNEAAQRSKTKAAVGLARAEWGANFAMARVCEYLFTIPIGQVSFWSPVVRNPLTLPVVDATDAGLLSMRETLGAYDRLPLPERRAAELAYRWNAEALTDDGHDSLIKTWIAIEAMSMQGETNIGVLKDLLARAYETGKIEVNALLGLGLLFGLRSRIVHGVELGSMHGAILDHAQAIFRDVARARLGLRCGRFALQTAPEALPLLRKSAEE